MDRTGVDEDERAAEWGRAAMVISEVSGVTVWFGADEQEAAINKAFTVADNTPFEGLKNPLYEKVWNAAFILDNWDRDANR